jgi:ABC-type sugar transport system ATPase subunit
MASLLSNPASGAASAAPEIHVRMRGIAKRYGARFVLTDIDLDIHRGEVHALVGENGAGKSTLGKVLAGLVSPTAGDMEINGEPVALHAPRHALRHGVTAITQELSLVPDLSVLDNVFLGMEEARVGVRRRSPLRKRYQELVALAGFTPNPVVRVGSLPLAEQQMVEILRALARGARLIIFDEPTTVLDATQTDRLHRLLRRLRDAGTTIVYVSHFLEEVLGVADRVTVLRDGRLIRTSAAREETPRSLISAMLGRDLAERFPPKAQVAAGAPLVLDAKDLAAGARLNGVSLQLHEGEILGVAGLVGSGRTELLRAIFGADRSASGELVVGGRKLRGGSPRHAIAAGMAFVPEDRRAEGLVIMRSVKENVTMATLDNVCSRGLIRRSYEESLVEDTIRQIDIRGGGSGATVDALSGGNQQKVLFAKWLLTKPKILLADEPTRGVDVGAKRAIYDLLVQLAASGTAVILVSSEVEEIVGLANRVIVLRNGRRVTELTGKEICEERITAASFGETELVAA